MHKAGYNPWGMIELLELLQSLSKSSPGLFKDLLASHPLTSRRIKDARKIIGQRYAQYSAQAPDPRAQRFAQMRKLLQSISK